MKEKKNVVGLIGFILSIVSIFTFGLTSFVGLILSIVGVATAKDYNNDKKKLSIAGIVISSIMLLVFISTLTSASDSGNSSTSSIFESTSKKVKVIDFKDMSKDSIEKWCKENNITCYFSDEYSDSVENGKVINQSVQTGESINPSSVIRFSMSKGRQKSAEEIKNEFIATCGDYGYQDIARNPDNYEGKHAKFTGKVIQVSEGYFNNVTLRVDVTKGEYDIWDDTVYVNYKYSDGESKILEDDIITMYGTIDGLKSYTSVLGAKITIPEFTAQYITIN